MIQKETKKITIKKNKWNKNTIMNEFSRLLPSYFDFDKYEKDERAIGGYYRKNFHFHLRQESWRNEEYNIWNCHIYYEDGENLKMSDNILIPEYCSYKLIEEKVEILKNSIAEIITGNIKV